MILIGQHDFPFVRRVAIALDLYGIAYAHRLWSTFSGAEQLAAFNPLRQVPTLAPDDGAVLIDSHAILDWLDKGVGPARALIPASGVARRDALKICALATGLADKAVSLLYERLAHDTASPTWIERCHAQIAGVLNAPENGCSARATSFWFGNRIGHVGIAVACAPRFTREAHPSLFNLPLLPGLESHAARCEALDPFRRIARPLIPPGEV